MTQQIKGPLKEIHFVTGKGGVGKSTYAALLAHEFALRGKKTLLVEIGERSYYASLFGRSFQYKPQKVENQLEVAHWSSQECLKSYVLSLVKVQALYKLFFENPISQSLIQVAPALAELSVMGQITSSPRQYGPHGDHEVLVVDAYATGHFLNLLRAPEAMAETIQFGPMHEQSQKMQEVLAQSGMCHCHIVTLAEELVLTESFELYDTLKKELNWNSRLVLNRYLNTTLKARDLQNKSQLLLQALHNKLFQQETAIQVLKEKDNAIRLMPLLERIHSYEDFRGFV